MNRGRRRLKGCGLSDILGYELRAPPPNPNMIKIVGQKSKCIMLDYILDSDIDDTDVNLKRNHYGLPG